MTAPVEIIQYPRRTFIRSLLRFLGRILIPILFTIEITDLNKLPKKGPIIVVGNHTAIMETILLICYAPCQIELLGAADIPHEKISQIFSDLFGYIPINRGHVDRPALRTALRVLEQDGVLGIFPEGGIWEPGLMRAQTGVSWLSYHGNSPVCPIGFSGTLGAFDRALKFKRPKMVMKVGDIISPIQITPGTPRKILFEDFAEYVMSQVRELLLPDDPSIQTNIKSERFELETSVWDNEKEVAIPKELVINHKSALSKFFHRPAILKIFRSNLKLPITPLENLISERNPTAIGQSLQLIIDYLENENPYLLAYRFGPKTGEEMKLGLQELLALTIWARQNYLNIEITPIRCFFSIQDGNEIIQTEQGLFEGWM